ncbi:MAG: hypothetical protein K2P17_04015 [Helicobacteraceae bacterium]|nr:hypothetical protein [Helicobacteraceae bacterium]
MQKIDDDKIKIDTIRGIATPKALERLLKNCKIKRFPKKEALFSIEGAFFMKLKKSKEKIKFEIFNLEQYYKYSKTQLKVRNQIIKKYFSLKTIEKIGIDCCYDTFKPLNLIMDFPCKAFKTTAYITLGKSKLCIYDKNAKNSHAPRGLTRYELTLEFPPTKLKVSKKTAKKSKKRKPTNPPPSKQTKRQRIINMFSLRNNFFFSTPYLKKISQRKVKGEIKIKIRI